MKIHLHTNNWFDHPVYRTIMGHLPEPHIPHPTEDGADIVFMPTNPTRNTAQIKPWYLFIEDWVTIYGGNIVNGTTKGVNVLGNEQTARRRDMFNDPLFKGIVCHHRGTFRDLVHLNLTDKLFYMPFGLEERPQINIGDNPVTQFTFINSWKAGHYNFQNRGGELVLMVFKSLYDAQPNVPIHLTIVAGLGTSPEMKEFARNCPMITVIENHISDVALNDIMIHTDCMLLPSHRVHVVSILKPFSYGIPVISSDGWGTDEYIMDGVNGYRIKGIWGQTSFSDTLFRESYKDIAGTYSAVPELIDKILLVASEPELLKRLGRNAYEYVNMFHSINNMQKALTNILK